MTVIPSRQPSSFKGEGVNSRPVGEVVQASTTGFVTQCHRLYDVPALGALVRCGGDAPIYAVVGEVTTQSIDAGRRLLAVGEGEEREEDVDKTDGEERQKMEWGSEGGLRVERQRKRREIEREKSISYKMCKRSSQWSRRDKLDAPN